MSRLGAVGAALLLAAVFLAVTVALQLSDDAQRLAGSNDTRPDRFLFETRGKVVTCQDGEILFEGTERLQATIGTFGRPGPDIAVTIRKRGRTLARGALPEGFAEGVVQVPVRPVARADVGDVEICFAPRQRARLAYAGEPSDPSSGATTDGRPRDGRLSLLSFEAAPRSLLEQANAIARRYGAGNAAWLGPWTWVLMGLALLGALVAAGAAVKRTATADLRRVPGAARLCALAAFLATLTWALLIPPFHVPDEIAHVGYTQILAETGKLPHEDYAQPVYSPQQNALLSGLQFHSVIGNTSEKPPWTAVEEAALREVERADLGRDGTNAATASNNPPLYYLLATPVYGATRSASLLTQLLPLRLLSVLFGALTVLAVFAFLRELLPRSPWTWTGGALVAAFQPVFGFMSAGVNPDALLFLCAALTFLAMVRLLRRGLSLRRAAALAAAVAAGALTKPLFLALVPAAAAAGLVAVVRALRAGMSKPDVLRATGVGAAIAILPVVLYHVVGTLAFDHGYFGRGTTAGELAGAGAGPGGVGGGLRHQISYIWQLFLPRMPWMNELFPPPETLPLRSIWFDGLVGRFGWLDYSFGGWVTGIAVWVAVPVLVAAAATLVVHRRALTGRRLELACYAVAVLGIVAVIGTQQWNAVRSGGAQFIQPRYLLPLLALYAALAALALRLFGRRAGPVLGVALAAITALHTISSMLLTVVRYYT